MHSIRFKITALTILAVLTTILCVSLASYSTVRAENDRRSVEVMNLIAGDTQKSLEKHTESIEQSVEMVANLATNNLDSVELSRGGVFGDHAKQTRSQTTRLDAYLADYIDKIQKTFAAVAGHTHGVVTYYYCINPDVSKSEHGFFYSKVGKPGFAEREPIDARELDPIDIEHTTWYYTPLKRGYSSWIGPYTAHFLDEMQIVSYLVPIYKSGTSIGVLGMDIPLETLVTQVSAIKVYDTGFACLMDEEGRVIYHPELESGSILDRPVPSDIFQRENSGDELIRYTVDGEERQMSFTTLSNGMKLAVIAPTREINASSYQLVRIIAPITFAVIVLFAIIILLAMRFLTQPLLRLTAASQKLAAKDYDVELDYKGKDEVGVLTNAFQLMRDQLKTNIEDLQRMAFTDDLTGLPNQRRFFELAEEEKSRLLEDGKHPVLLYFNLISMKHFNRKFGFGDGDQLIREVASILVRHFGEQNASRFGQDHFAAITDEERLEERLDEVFEECRSANGGKSLPVSVGIYQISLEDVGVGAACDCAKYACDLRKGVYASGFSYFDTNMAQQVETARHVISHLDEALEERWIEVHYQPIVRAVNGRVCDEEALSRWMDPTRGFLSPADFIPALEDAGLIYRLDLYVLDQVLEKIRLQKERGLTVVPHSINLSRSDFETCDIVEEIRKRVDAAGIDRDRITIEITESVIGRDFDFMKEQVSRFQKLGFPVWMDDFGSGYSSLDVLQSIRFDLIKFDMSFLRKLDDGDEAKIILTELMKMTASLGIDTVCEGVETKEQSAFLQEIGCSKLQGYYYCKPISLPELLERYGRGDQIGFENPQESDYYEAIGKVNLYDLAAISNEEPGALQNTFNMLPTCVLELNGDIVGFVRTNRSYRDFVERYFGFDFSEPTVGPDPDADSEPAFLKLIRDCGETGNRSFFDETMSDGSIVHSFIRRVGKNPVTGSVAVAIAILSIHEPEEGTTYSSIARALAKDYYYIYYVDLDTEQFIEYSSPVGGEELSVERHGEQFFASSHRDAMVRIHEEDREAFLASFTKENVTHALDERGSFVVTYRLLDADKTMLATMKVSRMERGGRHIIVGVSTVDAHE